MAQRVSTLAASPPISATVIMKLVLGPEPTSPAWVHRALERANHRTKAIRVRTSPTRGLALRGQDSGWVWGRWWRPLAESEAPGQHVAGRILGPALWPHHQWASLFIPEWGAPGQMAVVWVDTPASKRNLPVFASKWFPLKKVKSLWNTFFRTRHSHRLKFIFRH